jgi:hypothetical protein
MICKYKYSDHKEDEMGRVCSAPAVEEKCTQDAGEKVEGNRPPRTSRSGRIVLRWILESLNGVVRTGLVWLRIQTSGGLL